TGMKVELTADKLDNVLTSNQADVIYRVCKEALTNSLRHGKAEHVSIIFKLVEKNIKLFIFDDGCGCREISLGLGLKGMRERVQEEKGSIAYGSDGEKGFNIHVELPVGGVIDD
ncbi:MAG: histidine kinase, partial [Bacillota bacterium]|nr:histidine kinase [Bacillota bacterium]